MSKAFWFYYIAFFLCVIVALLLFRLIWPVLDRASRPLPPTPTNLRVVP